MFKCNIYLDYVYTAGWNEIKKIDEHISNGIYKGKKDF